MDNKEQIIKILFEEVKQELERQMQGYKIEINDRLQVHVPAGNEDELKEFINSQKQYYEEWFSKFIGKPRVMPFTWKRYQEFVSESIKVQELKEEILDPDRRREVVLRHTRLFLYAQIIRYLPTLQFEEKPMPLFEQRHHKITVRYQR